MNIPEGTIVCVEYFGVWQHDAPASVESQGYVKTADGVVRSVPRDATVTNNGPEWYPPQHGDIASKDTDLECGVAIYWHKTWQWMWSPGWKPLYPEAISELTRLLVRNNKPYVGEK